MKSVLWKWKVGRCSRSAFPKGKAVLSGTTPAQHSETTLAISPKSWGEGVVCVVVVRARAVDGSSRKALPCNASLSLATKHSDISASEDKSQDKSKDKSIEKSIDQSEDKSTEKSKEKSIEKSEDKSEDISMDKSEDKTKEKSIDKTKDK